MTLVCQKQLSYSYSHSKSLLGIADQWDAILPELHFLKSSNLAIYENSVKANPIYVIVSDSYSKEVGLIYIQKNFVNLNRVGAGFINLFKSKTNAQKGLELLIVGNTYSTDNVGVYGVNEEVERQIYLEILPALDQMEIQFDGIILKDLIKKTATPKFKLFQGDFGMELEIKPEWKDIEGYAATLEKKYFKRYKKIIASLGSVIVKEIQHIDFPLYQNAIWDLFESVLKKQSTQVGVIKENYFSEFLKKPKTKLFGYFENEKLVAFSLHNEKTEQALDIHLVGLDYESNEKYSLYLNILFQGVSEALRLNKKILTLGRTALTAKSSLGAQPAYKIQYYYFKNKLIHWSFKYILRSLYEKQVLEVRSPFKESV
jgi:hypothetical protein